MKETRIIMGMPITVEIVDSQVSSEALEKIFAYFTAVDEQFSTYKDTSEISRINSGKLTLSEMSATMKEVFDLAEKTEKETHGFFNIKRPDGLLDPSGIVKGWAIKKAHDILLNVGFKNFFIDAGGDIQTHGKNKDGADWSVGIRNPFKREEVVKVIFPKGAGVATSGTAIRGQHIWVPGRPQEKLLDVVSITVIGPDVLEADRFATAAFAMGRDGIHFIEVLPGFEACAIDASGVATMTSGFENYLNC